MCKLRHAVSLIKFPSESGVNFILQFFDIVVYEQLGSASLHFGKVKLLESFKLQIYIFLYKEV